MEGSEFSYDNLNTLCWAAGSLSENLPYDGYKFILEERSFFIKTLRDLLTLVDIKKGKEAKATIASNIMYLVG